MVDRDLGGVTFKGLLAASHKHLLKLRWFPVPVVVALTLLFGLVVPLVRARVATGVSMVVARRMGNCNLHRCHHTVPLIKPAEILSSKHLPACLPTITLRYGQGNSTGYNV